MTIEATAQPHDGLTDEQRLTKIAELLVLGAIAAIGLAESHRDRGSGSGACDESKGPENARSP